MCVGDNQQESGGFGICQGASKLTKAAKTYTKGHLHWLVGGRDDSHMNHMIAGPMRRDLVSVNIPTRDSS